MEKQDIRAVPVAFRVLFFQLGEKERKKKKEKQ